MNSNSSTQFGSGSVAPVSRMEQMEKVVAIAGRVLIATLFILAGVAKITGPTPFLEHMTRFGIPTFLLPGVIVLELGGGVAILIGWRIRYASGALGAFCVLTAAIFHHELWIKPELTLFLKDLAIAGGLFLLSTSATARDRIKTAAISG